MHFSRLFVTAVTLLHFAFFVFAQDITLLEHGGSVESVAFSPVDNTLVASAGGHDIIKLWNLRENTVKNLTDHKDTVHSVAFSPDGRLLVSGSDDRTVKIWDISQWQNVENLKPVTIRIPFPVNTVVFHPDGQRIATSGRHVKVLDINNRTEITTLPHDQWVWIVDCSRDGRYLATDDGTQTSVRVWDIQEKQIVATLEGHTSDVNFVKFSPDGRTLATSAWGGDVKVWSVFNWEHLGTLRNNGTAAIDFTPDGKMLASAGWEEITFWSAVSGEKLATLRGHTGWIRAIAFSSDGTTLASGDKEGTLRIQNIKTYLESQHQPNTVRLIYFLPSDRTTQPDIDNKIEAWVKDAQTFFADTMEKHGYGRKTFTYETDESGTAVVHHIAGKFTDAYYDQQNKWRVWDEIREAGFDPTENICIAFMDFSGILDGLHCGTAGDWDHGGVVNLIPSEECLDADFGLRLITHEMGHAFGLQHDYRNQSDVAAGLAEDEDLMLSSACSAKWLDAHRYFNTETSFFDEPTTIQMSPPRAVDAEGIRLRFTITDADGLHQARLLSANLVEDYFAGRDYAEEQDYLDEYMLDCKSLSGSSTTAEFITTQLTADNAPVVLRVIDVNGNFTEGRFSIDTTALSEHLADVNGDGSLDLQDLATVNARLGQTGENSADVNGDGVVDVADLAIVVGAIVAGVMENGAAAPSLQPQVLELFTATDVKQWLSAAQHLDITDTTSQRGLLFLQQLLMALTFNETALLSNYPNPFNPETWIPYRLAKPADVSISIYSVNGYLIRTLDLGYQPVGIYESRSRAAYWDGRNAVGEPVASGVYFYTLTAGDFTATRKMWIRK